MTRTLLIALCALVTALPVSAALAESGIYNNAQTTTSVQGYYGHMYSMLAFQRFSGKTGGDTGDHYIGCRIIGHNVFGGDKTVWEKKLMGWSKDFKGSKTAALCNQAEANPAAMSGLDNLEKFVRD